MSLISLVDNIISLYEELEKATVNSTEWLKLKDEIERAHRKIDEEVYKLCMGLTERGIKVVEGEKYGR